ncbi:hypothetical protein ACFOLC_13665 [Lysobacter cavernae]|uniref:DUF3617 family protein n=1 Tax=Lysobacter cavernae TaxID=1685901 RepID=A0ABV7RQZ8_9GAMM
MPARCIGVFHAVVWMALLGCGMAAAEPPLARVGALPEHGPYQQFIVKYRAGSAPANDPAAVPARVDATVAATGLDGADAAGDAQQPGVKVIWQRRLAVEADVIRTTHPLDREQAGCLMRQFAADPEVDYIEVDRMMTIQSSRRL